MNQKLTLIGVGLLLIGVGIVFGWYFRGDCKTQKERNQELRQNLSDYKFINPLLECETDQNLTELRPSKYNVEQYLAKPENKDLFVSVYYRDLNNGPWFGINEKENFAPASLLKLPIMMSYLKQAEKNPEILKTEIQMLENNKLTEQQIYPPKKNLEVGKSYTVEELIYRMIIFSDNESFNLLYYFANDFWYQIYQDLHLDTPQVNSTNDFMSVKNYASFFRILFNSSYLSKSNSNKSLKLLSETDFNQGISNAIPKDILIAHKFGERQIGEKRQLHDCGIVYYPGHPYLLCIMTRGNNFTQQEKVLQDISRMIYDDVAAQNKKQP